MSHSARPRRRLRLARGLVLLAAAGAAPLAGAAGAAAADRVETPIQSSSPQTDVVSSAVRIRVPLPVSAGAHPEACDWLSYMRYRAADGPTDPTSADAVAVLMPGVIEGATAFDPVARNTIREARRRGRRIEVWSIDRRSNCLEDRTGIEASERAGDVDTMLGYYYGKKAVDGRTFEGFSKPNAGFLAELGIAQTVRDYNAVLTTELPSQPWRERHVICGGHSLGGPITEAYAAWDFDGNPATTEDAGYRQCAGFIGFDTELKGAISSETRGTGFLDELGAGAVAGGGNATIGAIRAGIAPRYVDLLGISPETMGLLEAIGYLADTRPNEDWSPTLARVPDSPQVKDFLHLAGSSDLGRWWFSGDSMRDFRYTYPAALGQIMDDNGAVFGLVRSSFGFFDGTAVRPNELPGTLGSLPALNQLIEPGNLVLPKPSTPKPLIRWRNYDALGAAPAVGAGWTTPGDEITDVRDFARILHEGPLSLTENYFPVRLYLDFRLAEQGDRDGDFAGIKHADGILRKPRFVVIAGDGVRKEQTTFSDPYVRLPGYEHLDVITASERQNDGRPEGSSQAFANLIDQAVPR